MEIVKFSIMLIVLVSFNTSYSQEIVRIKIDTVRYHKQANDSLTARFELQKDLINNPEKLSFSLSSDRAISKKYNREELQVKSLPIFKISSEGSDYECGNSFLDVVGFNHRYIYQIVMIYNSNNSLIGYFPSSHISLEESKYYPPDLETTMSRMDTNDLLYQDLFTKEGYNGNYGYINFEGPNFFFGIYGIDPYYILFEIDPEGKLYVHDRYKKEVRMLAVEYIPRFLSSTLIQQLGRGNYDPPIMSQKCDKEDLTNLQESRADVIYK